MTTPETPRPEERPALRRWKVVLFLTLILGVFAVVLEVGAHYYLKATRGYDGKHLIQYAFDPYKNIVPTPNFIDTRGIQHNSVGFRRSGEVSLEKPPGTYRIFLMGASTAYGLGGLWPHIQREYDVIDNTATIDAYLERSLADAFPGVRVEVINAAITSTWTHHNLIYLNQRILRYQPDMILFMDGFNDFYFTGQDHDQFASYAYGEQSSRIMGDPTLSSLAFQNFWWLYRKSAFVHLMTRELRKVAGMFRRPGERKPLDAEAEFGKLQRTFTANALPMIQRSALITRAAGVIPVEIHQPLLILERDRPGLTGVERELFDYNVTSYLPNYETFMQRAVPWVADTVAKTVAQAGGHFIDATGIYRDATGQIFTDYCHLTPTGNELLASHIEAAIRPLISADLAARSSR